MKHHSIGACVLFLAGAIAIGCGSSDSDPGGGAAGAGGQAGGGGAGGGGGVAGNGGTAGAGGTDGGAAGSGGGGGSDAGSDASGGSDAGSDGAATDGSGGDTGATDGGGSDVATTDGGGSFICPASGGSCLFSANQFCYENENPGNKASCTSPNVWSDLPCKQRTDITVYGGCEHVNAGGYCEVLWVTQSFQVSGQQTLCTVEKGTWHTP